MGWFGHLPSRRFFTSSKTLPEKYSSTSLSFVFLAFASQASVSAQSLPGNSIPPQKLVDNLCSQIDELDIEDDEDRIAEMVSTQIAELDNPNVDQIVALSQVAVQLKTGQDIDDICD